MEHRGPDGAQKSLRSVEGNIFAGGFSSDWLNIKKNGEQSFSVHVICTSVFNCLQHVNKQANTDNSNHSHSNGAEKVCVF